MIHQLKTLDEFFEQVVSGVKPFEVRVNDRGFLVGDFLALNEVNRDGNYTGRCCLVEATYILYAFAGLQEGYCCIGIRPCGIGRSAERNAFRDNDFYSVPAYQRNEDANGA